MAKRGCGNVSAHLGLHPFRPRKLNLTMPPGLIYSRINNPDLEMLEDRLAIGIRPKPVSSSPRAWRRSRPHSGPMRAQAR
jgi:hypothetical protein